MNEVEALRAAMKADPRGAALLQKMAREGKLLAHDDKQGAIDTDDVLIVIAALNHGGITGATQSICECGRKVWISPSTQAMLKERGAKPHRKLCIACFVIALKKEDDEKKRS
jgi:hypothetical protein